MLTLGGRRCDIDIIADILQLGEAGKTEIIGATRITHSQLNRYLARLLTLKLVEKQDSGCYPETYRVTAKGRKLLYTIKGIRQMLRPKLPLNVPQSFNP